MEGKGWGERKVEGKLWKNESLSDLFVCLFDQIYFNLCVNVNDSYFYSFVYMIWLCDVVIGFYSFVCPTHWVSVKDSWAQVVEYKLRRFP